MNSPSRLTLPVVLLSIACWLAPTGSPAQHIAAGNSHTVVVCRDSTVLAWGWNGNGQLGTGAWADASSPTTVAGLTGVVAVATGELHSLALKSDGTVWAWGWNTATGFGPDINSPAQVPGFTDVVAIAGGYGFSLALNSDGTAWAWGTNENGQLGNGTMAYTSDPVQITGLSGITALAGGDQHGMALRNDGTVWAWGANEYDQLGDGTFTNSLVPIQVPGLSGVIAIDCSEHNSMVLRNDGSLWGWGRNSDGALGMGNANPVPTPTQITGISQVASFSVSAGHCLAMRTDGSTWSWGSNLFGQLGLASDEPDGHYLPEQIHGVDDVGLLSGIYTLEAGLQHSMALKNDGDMVSWGGNDAGQLGDAAWVMGTRNVPGAVVGTCVIAASVSEVVNPAQVSLFPNPSADGTVYLRVPANNGAYTTLRVHTLDGRLLLQRSLPSSGPVEQVLQLGDLAAGLYTLTLEGSQKRTIPWVRSAR